MKRSIWLISIVLLACGSKQQLVKKSNDDTDIRPAWVNSRPISSVEYIGVGRALKSSGDHALHAKRSALNDLASEIEVTVSSESVMYTLEHNERFEERYYEAIFLNTDLDLEGFQAVDSWENEDEYWIYYRLDRMVYERVKAKKRKDAIDASLIQLEMAFEAYDNADPAAVAMHSIRVLELVRPYWNEPNPGGRYSDVGQEAIRLLARTRNAIDFIGVPDHIRLDETNAMRIRLEGAVLLNGRKVIESRVKFIDGLQEFDRPAAGYDLVVQARIGADRKLNIIFDPFEELRNTRRSVIYDFLNEMIAPIEKEIDVHTVFPIVQIVTTHGGLEAAPSETDRLRSVLIRSLNDAGIPVVENDVSRYIITLSTHSRDGGISFGQQIVWTEGLLVFKDDSLDNMKRELAIEEVKGIHLDLPSAQRKSMEKISERISNDLLEALIYGQF